MVVKVKKQITFSQERRLPAFAKYLYNQINSVTVSK